MQDAASVDFSINTISIVVSNEHSCMTHLVVVDRYLGLVIGQRNLKVFKNS